MQTIPTVDDILTCDWCGEQSPTLQPVFLGSAIGIVLVKMCPECERKSEKEMKQSC